MQQPLNLIINNQDLSTNGTEISSSYLSQILGYNLSLPDRYIYSCFALSVDGKLRTQDDSSGYIIAHGNHKATLIERQTDYWYLNLARALADAVIVGSGILASEPSSDYLASVTIDELAILRNSLGKPQYPLHIIITRDMSKLNWPDELILQDNIYPVLIISSVGKAPSYFGKLLSDQLIYQNKSYIVLEELDVVVINNYLQSNHLHNILIESPYYHHKFIEASLLHEAWLNYSGIYIGGQQTNLGSGANSLSSDNLAYYTIITMHCIGYNFLYGRYSVSYETK